MEIEATTKSNSSPMFYLIAIVVLVIILIIILIKKLNFNLQQIIRLIAKSFVITLIINLIGFVILYFTSGPIMCEPCPVGLSCHCPTVIEILSSGLIYTIPAIFLLVLLVSLIFKKIKQ